MIPKRIHLQWQQSFDLLPTKFESNIRSIVDKNPDWLIYKWDENSAREAIKKYLGQVYIDKLDSFKLLHQRVDFQRISLLWIYGGASIDTDVEALKSLNETPYIDTDDFLISRNSSSPFENLIAHGHIEHFNNATILVSQNNPILKGLLDHFLSVSCDLGESKYSCIQSTTGPSETTIYLSKFKDKIKILDNKYLEPCASRDVSCNLNLPEESILNHKHEGSWIDDFNETQKAYFRTKNVIKNTWWVFLIIIIGVVTLRKISLQK